MGGNSSEHACITQRAKEGMRQGSMEHTLHHSTNTHTPEHSMHAAWPALNHSDRATGFLYSSSRLPRLCRVQAQWQAGRPVSAPSAHGGPCHWALASPRAQSVQSRRAICHERTEKGFLIRFCLHAPASSSTEGCHSICTATCHSYRKLVFLARWGFTCAGLLACTRWRDFLSASSFV